MSYSNRASYRRQREFLRHQFLQDGKLPFADVLSRQCIDEGLKTIGECWNNRVYTPLMTLWVFLGQVLSVDHSCRGAVARLVAHRVSCGLAPCSSRTGAYCRARKRLPEKFFATIARTVGRELTDREEQHWLWKGRRVYMFDGTTISMPDTPSNQEAFPQSNKQTPGVGFPLARVAAVLSLSSGAILDLAVAAYSGKGQGEVTLLRQLWNLFQPGDVLLTDSLMCNWRNLYELQQRGVHVVTRINKALRKADFRRGQRLGKDDHLVDWPKPHIRGVGRKAQRTMPRQLTVREARVRIEGGPDTAGSWSW
ncbi:MAG: IS4 family transposase [Pirellulales bacterium]